MPFPLTYKLGMGQHVLFLVLVPLLLAPAVHGFRARTASEDMEIQVAGQEKVSHSITEERCGVVVSEVQKSKSYTEESIRPICDREIKSSRCDFFAETLSLASSHADFNGKSYCESIVSAQFCAQTMDRLLTSQAMADLARGDCNRAPNSRGSTYCEKFQNMLAYSVQNDDLDTMRACYMMEAYSELGTAGNSTNKTEGAANKTTLSPSHDSPENRIISSSSKELESHGEPSAAATEKEAPEKEAAAAEKEGRVEPVPEKPKSNETEIVVEPVPEKPKSNEIVTEPVPTQPKGNSTIATDPIYIKEKNADVPTTQEEAAQLKPIGSEVNTPPAETKGEQPAATVPADAVPVNTMSSAVHAVTNAAHQIREVRLNIGGPANFLSAKAKAIIASKVPKRNASQVTLSNTPSPAANTTF